MGTMLLLLAVALCAGNDPSADDLIARGKAALAAGKYPEAVAQLKKALAADRYNSVALFTLADLYVHQLPDQKLHDEYWKRYSAASIMGLGEAAALEGDTGGAAARYREALRLTPDDPGLHERLGMVLAQGAKRDEALEEFKKAAAMDPQNGRRQLAVARVLWDLRREREAAAFVDRALSLSPSDPSLKRAALALFVELGDRERALAQLVALAAAGAATPQERCTLAEVYLKEGKLDDALRELSKGFGPPTRERSLRAARALTEAYLKRGERDKSVALCNAILGTGAAAVEEYNSLAVAYQQMGKLDAAAGVAEKGVAAFPASAELHNNLATIYALRTEYARAAQEYQRAVELKPGLAEAYLDMGIIYNEYLKRPEKAAEAFRSYVVLKPEGKKRPDIAELLGSGAAER